MRTERVFPLNLQYAELRIWNATAAAFRIYCLLSYRPDEGQDLHASSCNDTTQPALLFMAVEQKQCDKDDKWGVSMLRCIPVSTETRFKPSSSIDYYCTIMTLKKFKTQLCTPSKLLKPVFSRYFSIFFQNAL